MGGQRNWSTVKPEKNRVDIESLFEKMDAKKVTLHDSRDSSNSSLNSGSTDYDPDLSNKSHVDVSRDLERDFDKMMTSNERGLAESALATLEAVNDADKDSSEMNSDELFVGKIAVEDGTMIEVHGTSEDELTKFLAGEKIDLDDGGAETAPDGAVAPAEWSETATRGQQQPPDLRDQEVWREYYQKIRKAEREVGERRGWGNFDAVFMLSALEGDGVVDLKVSVPKYHSLLVSVLSWSRFYILFHFIVLSHILPLLPY